LAKISSEPSQAALGGYHEPVAVFSQRLGQGLFGVAESVGVGRIKEVDTEVPGSMDGRDGFFVINRPPAFAPHSPTAKTLD
jgi:hypothetical protein